MPAAGSSSSRSFGFVARPPFEPIKLINLIQRDGRFRLAGQDRVRIEWPTKTLEDPIGPERRPDRRVAAIGAREVTALAVAGVHVPEGVSLDVDTCDAMIEADRREVALAVRCLVENAIELCDQVEVVRRPWADPDAGVHRFHRLGLAHRPDELDAEREP